MQVSAAWDRAFNGCQEPPLALQTTHRQSVRQPQPPKILAKKPSSPLCVFMEVSCFYCQNIAELHVINSVDHTVLFCFCNKVLFDCSRARYLYDEHGG